MKRRIACLLLALGAAGFPAAQAKTVSRSETGSDRLTDALIARIKAIDPRVAHRHPPPFAAHLVACEGYLDGEGSCTAIVRTVPDVELAGRFERSGAAILVGEAGYGALLLTGRWVETERDGFYCSTSRPEFGLRLGDDGADAQGLPAQYRGVLTRVRERMKMPLCSFWTGEGMNLLEVTYDGAGREVTARGRGEMTTRFLSGEDAARVQLRL